MVPVDFVMGDLKLIGKFEVVKINLKNWLRLPRC